MESSYTPLPAELRQAIRSHGGEPLHLLDHQTQKVYVLIEKQNVGLVDDDYVRGLLQEADEDIARGDVGEWDLEEIKVEGRRLLAERRAKLGQ